MEQPTAKTALQMQWDASTIRVSSILEAIGKARKLELGWFDLAEWNYERQSWTVLGSWAKDHVGRFVSIPASEDN